MLRILTPSFSNFAATPIPLRLNDCSLGGDKRARITDLSIHRNPIYTVLWEKKTISPTRFDRGMFPELDIQDHTSRISWAPIHSA